MKLLALSRRPAQAIDLSERDRRLVWRVAALLLDYPSEQTVELTAQLIAAAMQLPSAIHAGLLEFLYHFRGANLLQLQANYVETFDMRRRASLHLTYYAYGDTRKRGMALLRFKHAYRQAATGIGDGELPDYLPLVLEFAAMIDQVQGERLLVEHVPVLELLRLSLQDSGSVYAGLLTAILATLPPISTADRRRIAELAAQGPPDEEVGLEPFAMDPLTAGGRR
ncbi:MAG: nitrate reductase molybdenum cofactor assembly chaperone [Mycobacterium pseudokansasii]|uniref:Nitrate reductase-like protein NarX n=1 Tax=Mycobacterium pseudokansasii TaxID=2341080 RepID=A0A498QXW0_9MYCO|nr:nitrate reductase molybdenum cofactor assembly chaperone [Mycobacterium pseudokansasii]KZS66369.1 nitrate reductase molybdenum cofactor assembly chaperone [Mycobacterium kansasii]MBY0389757.1 nitrate reductase molybdenum cofactor assembly chaperone [Mycobacterium pseudokansasii]VAZ97949.1 Nitrate reductase-like protein NarX [Mycobacterium pseudokansasii]VAZ99489.1 Nitrate reductase-like protein NarX [Mycobacterium pseudokansasii]VBA52903.1 Nitrate reductase-like protein NarX [Mycobacterium 